MEAERLTRILRLQEVRRLMRSAERYEREIISPRIEDSIGHVISTGDRAAQLAYQQREDACRILGGIQGARFAPYRPWPPEQMGLGLDIEI